jgi:predicted dehydrogenase
MVGGGPGSFIGAVHRAAARLDGRLELVAGAFASTEQRSRETGARLGLGPARVYDSWERMLASEADLPEERRIHAVSVVVPNHLHHPVAIAALRAGFHVVCDKPLTNTVAEADDLVRSAREHDRVFCVTHNYTGYPMVKEARERVRGGALGDVRKVVVEYTQGWLATLLQARGHKQATWRADPERGGVSSALADIGSHAHNLAEYVTGLRIERLFADLGTVVEGRRLEDDAALLLRLSGGVRGVLTATQVATGERNHLRLRVYGSEGGLDWCQERPDALRLTALDGPEGRLYDGVGGLSERARAHTRLPSGHPEGFIEAFGNLYRNFAATVAARAPGANRHAPPGDGPTVPGADAFADDFPTVEDGARGVRFIHAAVRSAREGRWEEVA